MKCYLIVFFLFHSFSFSQINENISLPNDSVNSITSIKLSVKKNIDSFAYDEDSNKRRYKVKFEGDYMRLLIMKADGSKPINKGLLYDFSNVYKFDGISFRRKDIAYINIYLDFLDKENYPKRKKWVKIKLIMKVFGHENAKIIMASLKDYNEALKNK
ncbi:hypothetical protein [Hanstruepera ponticola]|uniref:hypothetical protein n=1 Tax=Hanstruepera ponticola TaxID=2042995 RepID=UPI00178399E8|nr:hypothetical protein [Hanstruepera ponticola]